MILEADSLKYTTEDVLSQFNDKGVLRSCVYFLKKNSSAECNYKIHNKKVLVVIHCLQEWDSELHSVKEFTVITDHKNLKYFTQPQKLSKQHMRWSIFLSRYNMTMKYHSESKNNCADALSQKNQDNLNEKDEWTFHQFFQLLRPISASLSDEEDRTEAVLTMTVTVTFTVTMPTPATNECNEIEWLWTSSTHDDKDYAKAWQAIREEAKWFPPELNLKASIVECQTDDNSTLQFRNWCWAPKLKPLQTALIHDVHTFILTDHIG